MKKLLVIVLTLAMVMSVFVACGQDQQEVASGQDQQEVASEEVSENAEVVEIEEGGVPAGIQPGSEVDMYLGMDCVTNVYPGDAPLPWLYSTLYDTLFVAEGGDWNNIVGLLAEDWTVSEDSLTWVINIHDDVCFNNGNQLTAESVVGTMDYLLVNGMCHIAQIDSMEATDEYQVTFNLNAPMPEFMRQFALALQTGIFDISAIEGVENPTAVEAYKIGSGPYYISDYGIGDYMTFTANENYWNKDRMPHIETINCKIILDPTTQLATLQTGEMDYGEIADYTSYEILSADEDLNIIEGAPYISPLWFNAAEDRNNLLGNVNVRKAITMLVDREQVKIASAGDYGVVSTNAFNSAFEYDDGYVYDPDAGLALLEAEGVAPEDIVLEAITNSDDSNAISNVQSQLSSYGITINFTVSDAPAVGSLGVSGQWDLWTSGGGMTEYMFGGPIGMLISENAIFNVFNDKNVEPEIWNLVDLAVTSPKYEDEKAYIEQILQVLGENYAYLSNIQRNKWASFSAEIANPVLDGAEGYWLPWYSYVTE